MHRKKKKDLLIRNPCVHRNRSSLMCKTIFGQSLALGKIQKNNCTRVLCVEKITQMEWKFTETTKRIQNSTLEEENIEY